MPDPGDKEIKIGRVAGLTGQRRDLVIKAEPQANEDRLRKAKIIVEPLERGDGVMLGNALRRVLLSSLQGAAIIGVHIDGIAHQFSAFPGIREDVTTIILNLKQVAISMDSDTPIRAVLKAKGPGEVKAGQIETGGKLIVLNPDHIICTLDGTSELSMEFMIAKGKGYMPADASQFELEPIGYIPIDAIFSPVRRVGYLVEDLRQGTELGYDRLIFDIETDGSILPEEALAAAAMILQNKLQVFLSFE